VLNSKLDTIDKRISEYRADYINYPSEAKKGKTLLFFKKMDQRPMGQYQIT
jgi:hypothetical protein